MERIFFKNYHSNIRFYHQPHWSYDKSISKLRKSLDQLNSEEFLAEGKWHHFEIGGKKMSMSLTRKGWLQANWHDQTGWRICALPCRRSILSMNQNEPNWSQDPWNLWTAAPMVGSGIKKSFSHWNKYQNKLLT